MQELPTDTVPEILGLELRRYKNLRDVWLPWSDGLALFGVNGAGKTNLLECLALLLGSDQSVALARPRLTPPNPDDLSIILRTDSGALPWPPDEVMGWTAQRETVAEHLDVFPALARALADADWWRMLGAQDGADFSGGLASAGIPSAVAAYVSELVERPVLRYSLTRIQFPASVDQNHPGVVSRGFARTLLAPHAPPAVAEVADELPDAFAPLRFHLAADTKHPEGWVPVMELPPTHEPPATLQWLPRERTAAEVNSNLIDAFDTASIPAKALAEVLAGVSFTTPPDEQDWHWWLHEFGQDRGSEELGLTLPGISITAAGANDADFALVADSHGQPVELSHTGDSAVLEHFSSGERRWVDEALATIARELTRFAHRASLYTDRFSDLDEDTVLNAVLDVAGGVEEAVLEEGFWMGQAFDQLLHALEPALLAAARARFEGDQNVVTREMERLRNPGLSLLQPHPVVRVFDEPEAHLHPSAQRRVAVALNRLRLRGENVVIASHSPHFLDLPGWSGVHVQRVEDSTTVQQLTNEAGHARSALAKQLGINRGELLAGINGVLLVEGKHDELVLQRLYGTELRDAGLAVVRMYGTSNLLATAELDFVDRYLDVPITVLLDYVRIDRVERGRPQTEEEEKLVRLRRSCKGRNRTYAMVGLERPDVVCYLSEAALRQHHPSFPGWPTILAKFERRRNRPPFKPWLLEQFGVQLTHSGHIDAVLDTMLQSRHPPVGELTRRVEEILSHVPVPTFEDHNVSSGAEDQ